jgi:hypothetical protein
MAMSHLTLIYLIPKNTLWILLMFGIEDPCLAYIWVCLILARIDSIYPLFYMKIKSFCYQIFQKCLIIEIMSNFAVEQFST